MKQLYTSIFLLCVTFSGFSQMSNTSELLLINANFTGRHCNGTHGLCDWNTARNKRSSNGHLKYNDDETISLYIDRTKLKNRETAKLFGTAFKEKYRTHPILFEVRNGFVLAQNIMQRLQVNNSKTRLTQGKYPILITDEFFVITFNLE